MAIQTLQFCIVLAIGIPLAPALNVGGNEVTSIPPSLDLKDPEDVIVARGQSAVLHCKASSLENDHEILWLYNDTFLPENDPRWHIFKNGSLYAPIVAGKRMNASLEGGYRCFVKNSDGALLSQTAYLKIAGMKDFSRQPKNVIAVNEFQPIVIPCSINSVPEAHIIWERDNLPLPQNKRYVPLPTGSLLITNVHSTDSGYYRCKATNDILKKTKTSTQGRLEIVPTDAKVIAPLPLLTNLDVNFNINPLEGDNVKLYCIVKGRPQPTIQWLNGKNVVVGNSNLLSFDNINATHTGNYTCSAYNSGGRATQTYNLTVNEKPVFTLKPTSRVYPTAKTIRLDCEASGFPRPKIIWFKNGRPFLINNTFGRAYEQSSRLLISYSVASDAGFYQCLAINSAGVVWTAALVKLNFSGNSPKAPLSLLCQPYNSTSVCLQWSTVPNSQAYSVMAYSEVSGTRLKDYVTNETHILADNLLPNTNYTFSIRTYSKEASNEFVLVSCETGQPTKRNLVIEKQGDSFVKLKWSQVNSDGNLCAGDSENVYKVQWRKEKHSFLYSQRVVDLRQVTIGVEAGIPYEFKVQSSVQEEPSEWTTFTLPMKQNVSLENEVDYSNINESINTPSTPILLDATVLSVSSINLTWSGSNLPNIYYTICYVPVSANSQCEDGKIIKSLLKSVLIKDLKPGTVYEFKLKAHSSEGAASASSHAVHITTSTDGLNLPSSVQGLKYKLANSTSACVKWEPPLQKNGELIGYLLKYTPNDSWPLEQWIGVKITRQHKNKGCWSPDPKTVSFLLQNLDPEKNYMVIVSALNDAGAGNPTVPITISTKNPLYVEDNRPTQEEKSLSHKDGLYYKQGLGVILGLSISICLMVICMTCFLLWRRYKKVQMDTRRNAINTHTTKNECGLRGENCTGDLHEMQQLVETNGTIYIPLTPITPLDTKGSKYSNEYTNRQLNGNVIKSIHRNGNLPTNSVHITENPQYCGKTSRLSPPVPDSYEEDSNSNLQKLPPSKKLESRDVTVKLADKSFDISFDPNSTQLTCLEDSEIQDDT